MKINTAIYEGPTRWDTKSFLCALRSNFPIKELGEYIYNHSQKENIYEQREEEFSILGVTNKDGVYFNSRQKGENINQSYKKVRKGEIAYNPYRVNIGSIGIVPDKFDNFYISPAYVVFGTKEKLFNEYLFLILNSKWFNPFLRSATSGSVRQNLTYDLLARIKIPVPEIQIQRKIVSEFNKINDQFKKIEKQADAKKSRIDDILLKFLGVRKIRQEQKKGAFAINYGDADRWGVAFNSWNWTLDDLFASEKFELRKISSVASVNSNFHFPRKDKKKEISFVPMESISDEHGEIVDAKTKIIEDVLNGYTKFMENNVLFAKITPCMQNGKCAIAKNLKNNIGAGSTEFHVIDVDKNQIMADFLWNILRTKILRKSAQRFFIGSAGQQRVPEDFMKDLKIPVPPLPIQKKIVVEIDDIRKAIKQLRKEIVTLRQIADENLQRAIVGE